jgi:hypothetical protein
MPSRRSEATLAAPLALSGPTPMRPPIAALPSLVHGASRADGLAARQEVPSTIHEPAATEPLPLVHRGAPASPAGLEYVRASAKSGDRVPDPESIRRQVEERVERTIVERIERLVARQVAADVAPLSRICERVSAELAEALVLERERLGWS